MGHADVAECITPVHLSAGVVSDNGFALNGDADEAAVAATVFHGLKHGLRRVAGSLARPQHAGMQLVAGTFLDEALTRARA